MASTEMEIFASWTGLSLVHSLILSTFDYKRLQPWAVVILGFVDHAGFNLGSRLWHQNLGLSLGLRGVVMVPGFAKMIENVYE